MFCAKFRLGLDNLLEKKFLKIVTEYLRTSLLSMKNDTALHLNKLEFPTYISKDACMGVGVSILLGLALFPYPLAVDMNR